MALLWRKVLGDYDGLSFSAALAEMVVEERYPSWKKQKMGNSPADFLTPRRLIVAVVSWGTVRRNGAAVRREVDRLIVVWIDIERGRYAVAYNCKLPPAALERWATKPTKRIRLNLSDLQSMGRRYCLWL